MGLPIRILYIEDSEDDQILTLRSLKKEGMDIACKRVDTLKLFEEALHGESWDVVLTDYNVPGMNVLETLALLKAQGYDLPFILVSGTIGEETAVETMRAGAHDYVMKDNLARLPSAITREMADAQIREERRKSAQALFESERKLLNQVAQQNAMLAVDRAVHAMTTTEDLEQVVRVCFDQLQGLGLRFQSVAIKRVIDPVKGIFSFHEIQPTGKYHQFSEQSKNLFRKWRLGETVYRPNLDEDMGGLKPEDREMMSRRYGSQVNSILNICFDMGVLSVLSDEMDPFDASQITFLEQVALPISIGMHRLQDMEQLDAVVRHLPEGICLFDSFHQVGFANALGKKYLTQLGVDPDKDMAVEIDGLSIEILCQTTQTLPHQIELQNEAGTILEVMVRPIREDIEGIDGWVAVFRDVTLEIKAEALSQRQDRLASIGQLAAGIAHDFNNMLTVMGGFAQILEMNPDLDAQTKADLAQISEQGQRGAKLVRQILDFSRDTDVERQPLDILPFLKESVKLFQRTLPETISVREAFASGHYAIWANITQLQQVLHNLAVNARDAMPDGGKVVFGAEHVQVGPNAVPPVVGMAEGDWLMVTVADTGSGMAPDVLEHIFEPFFTTKDVGKGTGLGLAQVYGLVTKHDGLIDVQSVVGKGTTFSLYFPLVENAVSNAEADNALPSGNGEHLLVVEDNDQVLNSLKKMLEHLNYNVQVAQSVDEAMVFLNDTSVAIDGVLTDLVMPNQSGLDLFDDLQEKGINIPLTIMTGYPSEAKRFEDRIGETCGLLLKPLEMGLVAKQVKHMFS